MVTSDIHRRLENDFPSLHSPDYSLTSPIDRRYNCVAHAAGDSENYWWPDADGFWPAGIPRENKLPNFVLAFGTLGYLKCDKSDLESGFEKVAIYCAAEEKPTHAALQLDDGWWTSKLGRYVDIRHRTLNSLEGDVYGVATQVLRRLR